MAYGHQTGALLMLVMTGSVLADYGVQWDPSPECAKLLPRWSYEPTNDAKLRDLLYAIDRCTDTTEKSAQKSGCVEPAAARRRDVRAFHATALLYTRAAQLTAGVWSAASSRGECPESRLLAASARIQARVAAAQTRVLSRQRACGSAASASPPVVSASATAARLGVTADAPRTPAQSQAISSAAAGYRFRARGGGDPNATLLVHVHVTILTDD